MNTDIKDLLQFEDPHSFSNFQELSYEHINLNLKVDFNKKTLSGWAEYNLKFIDSNSRQIILDTRDLKIDSIIDQADNQLNFTFGKKDPVFGEALSIDLKNNSEKIKIYYETTPESAALQWLNPEQTYDKKHPFLFSQSQAILARTWIPIQDGPGIKFTYSADITVPQGYLALMSAKNPTQLSKNGVYHFEMKQPISSYLMALSVGVVDYKSTGRNSGVYAEPGFLDKCVWEFGEMQSMIDSAEELYGKYQWEQYDVIVLPPSFPFGGMENPRLTFATPTIIAGDRSLVTLIAHELAHSWSGNLVTNANWNDFWLNEGFTRYFENRIMEKIYGKEYTDMLLELSIGELKESIAIMTAEGKEKDTHLKLDLEGRDPDDGLTDIAYEKGMLILLKIEHTVGREKWDNFLKNYFNQFAFKPMTTEAFLFHLNDKLLNENESWKNEIDVDSWVYGPGLPNNSPVMNSVELAQVKKQLQNLEINNLSNMDTSGWTTHHWLYFLRNLPESINLEWVTALDKQFNFTNSGNSEILGEWFKLAIETKYETSYPALERFLTSVGRRKFLTPLYERMIKTPEGMKMAKTIYAKAKPTYHAVAQGTISSLLEESKP